LHFELAGELDVLDVRRVGVGPLGGLRERQRRQQALRINRVGQRLKQLERPQATLEQLQPVTVRREDAQDGRPLLGNLPKKLES
jgi:hypothetical protein